MYEELRDRFGAYKKRPDLGAIVLTGEGRGFCSGGDVEAIIGELLKMNDTQLHKFTKLTCDVVAAMRACPQPIIASLNGTVAGAALAIASDFRLAVPEAKIAFLFVKAGLSAADMGTCYLLPRIVGLGRATEMLMLGDFISAEQAHAMGLYNRIVPKDRIAEESRALAKRLAEGPREGLAMSKEALNRHFSMTVEKRAARFSRAPVTNPLGD